MLGILTSETKPRKARGGRGLLEAQCAQGRPRSSEKKTPGKRLSGAEQVGRPAFPDFGQFSLAKRVSRFPKGGRGPAFSLRPLLQEGPLLPAAAQGATRRDFDKACHHRCSPTALARPSSRKMEPACSSAFCVSFSTLLFVSSKFSFSPAFPTLLFGRLVPPPLFFPSLFGPLGHLRCFVRATRISTHEFSAAMS